MSNNEQLLSKTLIDLEETLQSQGEKAIDGFWRDIREIGTPLIEDIEGDPKHKLVTFIVKEEKDVDKFILMSVIGGEDLSNKVFNRFKNTDIFYKSIKTSNEVRDCYQIARDIPLNPEELGKNWHKYKKKCTADPLNPNHLAFPEDKDTESDRGLYSILELPKAPSQEWIKKRNQSLSGRISQEIVSSKILNNKRKIWVYTPHNYKEDVKPYHILLVFDAFEYLKVVNTNIILDNLILDKKIPPTVAVFVGNEKNLRNKDLSCNEDFAKFIAQELFPWLSSKYNVSKNSDEILVAGSSLGGLSAAFLGYRYPNIFGNIIAISGSFWWTKDEEREWLTRQYIKSDKLPLKFYLEVGSLEPYEYMLSTNRHFRNILECKGYVYSYHEFEGGHDYLCWRSSLSNGLISIIGLK